MVKLMLVDYITETLEKYDYTTCPDYVREEDPIDPEVCEIIFLETEDGYPILTEDDFLIFTEDSCRMRSSFLYTELDLTLDTEIGIPLLLESANTTSGTDHNYDHIEVEDSSIPIVLDNDYRIYLERKGLIEQQLQRLTKDINCHGIG